MERMTEPSKNIHWNKPDAWHYIGSPLQAYKKKPETMQKRSNYQPVSGTWRIRMSERRIQQPTPFGFLRKGSRWNSISTPITKQHKYREKPINPLYKYHQKRVQKKTNKHFTISKANKHTDTITNNDRALQDHNRRDTTRRKIVKILTQLEEDDTSHMAIVNHCIGPQTPRWKGYQP
ncbi:hypothetical protein BDF14DRAFT_1924291 [Spinellus fusiger]|nr:hypothetical protein BDF14DRAFT_1924291 [Spinellus fusiger]